VRPLALHGAAAFSQSRPVQGLASITVNMRPPSGLKTAPVYRIRMSEGREPIAREGRHVPQSGGAVQNRPFTTILPSGPEGPRRFIVPR